MQPVNRESNAMNDINSLLNQHQIPSLQEIHGHGHLSASQFDPTPSNDDFLEQILSSVPSSASSFPWADDQPPPSGMLGHLVEEQSAAVLASKLRQHQISNGAAKALMLQQQLLLARGFAGGGNGLRSPTAVDANGLLNMPHVDHNGVVDGSSFESAITANDASVKALFNGFTGSLGQTSSQTQHFNQGGVLHQNQNFGGASAVPAVNQPAASGSSGGGAAGQPRQRVRARRGQATDPHSIAERLRRERIAERMKSLQELVPNANKTDKASMLDEIIDYVKFLQLQVKVLSMSRLGGAAAVAPLVGDMSEGRNGNGTQSASSSNNNEGLTVTEQQVVKLMEEDMGSAMQYLQGKGLCLMPISLATAISTATCQPRNPLNTNGTTANHHPLLNNGEAGGSPTSTSMSALTIQSAAVGGNGASAGASDHSLKDGNSV